MSASELEIAATVTRGAVRCSAWLGVAVDWDRALRNNGIGFVIGFIVGPLIALWWMERKGK